MHPHYEPDSTGPDTGPAPAPPLSAIEAAGVASVNERTIRRAIRAGQLPARKHRGAYRISPADLAVWQADYEAGTPPDRAADTGPDRVATGHPSGSVLSGEGATVAELWRALEAEGKATAAATAETINRLDAEVADLRERLTAERDRAAEERRRFDILIHDHLQRIEVLTATTGDPRDDAPTTSPDALRRVEGAESTRPPSWWTTLLRKVRRG